MRFAGFLVGITMTLVATSASSQQPRRVLDDSHALVTQIFLSPGETYFLQPSHDQHVWIALDPMMVSDGHGREQVRAGDAAVVKEGGDIEFRPVNGLRGRVVIVKAKAAANQLTVGPFPLARDHEDANARNATLLVAISDCRFQDVRNRGDESTWLPGRAEIVTMHSGSVRWIKPGIHHFRNLGRRGSNVVEIEW